MSGSASRPVSQAYADDGFVQHHMLPRALAAPRARRIGTDVLRMQDDTGQPAGALLHHGHTFVHTSDER